MTNARVDPMTARYGSLIDMLSFEEVPLLSSSVEPHSRSRFAIVWPHIVIALAAFSVLRIALLAKAWPEVSHTLFNGIYIFALGLFYDLVFISYFCIPFLSLAWNSSAA